jgi:hypothetical protein
MHLRGSHLIGPQIRRGDVLGLHDPAPELTALLRQAGAIACEHPGCWGRPSVTAMSDLRACDFVLLAWPRSTKVASCCPIGARRGRESRPVDRRAPAGTARLRHTPSRGVAIAVPGSCERRAAGHQRGIVANAADANAPTRLWPADRAPPRSPTPPPVAHRTQRIAPSDDRPRRRRAPLAEHQRPAIARDHHSSHVTAQLPPIARTPPGSVSGLHMALHQLPRAIDRPLKRPRHHEPRADLPHMVIKHRLAARIAHLAGHLPQPLRLDPWVRR